MPPRMLIRPEVYEAVAEAEAQCYEAEAECYEAEARWINNKCAC